MEGTVGGDEENESNDENPYKYLGQQVTQI